MVVMMISPPQPPQPPQHGEPHLFPISAQANTCYVHENEGDLPGMPPRLTDHPSQSPKALDESCLLGGCLWAPDQKPSPKSPSHALMGFDGTTMQEKKKNAAKSWPQHGGAVGSTRLMDAIPSPFISAALPCNLGL
jgi:hypothetical protein